jgi:hypothetical protein
MSDPTYKRTTRSKNKLRKRRYEMYEVFPGGYVDAHGRRYVQAPDGAMRRIEKMGDGGSR